MGKLFSAKGVVTLRRINTITGKVEEEIVKENVFTTYGMRRAMKLDEIPNPFSIADYLMISQQSSTPSKGSEVVGQIIGDADSNASIPNAVIWEDETLTLPMYGEIRRRLDFQGSPRTFQTILVGDRVARNAPGYPNASQYNNWNSTLRAGQGTLTSIPAYCYLLLDNPVTQNSFDIVDIFYRVYFIPANGNGIPKNSELVRNIGRRLFGLTNRNPGSPTTVYTSPSSITNPEDYNFIFNVGFDDPDVMEIYNNVSLLDTSTYDYEDASVRYTTTPSSINLSMLTGRLIRSGSMGVLERGQFAITARDFLDPTRTPLQTSWAKRAGGRPFFSANDFSIGQGRIIPSIPLKWEQQYPDFYRILITKSGDVGEAEYRFERQRFVSYARNTWVSLPAPVFHTGGVVWDFKDEPFLPNSYGTDQKVRMELLGEDTIVFWNKKGITLVNILDSTKFRSIGSETATINPLDKLEVSDIRQVVVKGEFIYIACADTGIWKIDSTKDLGEAGYVSREYAGNAYAITLSNYQGVLDVYAVLDTGISFEGSNWVTVFTPSSPRLNSFGIESIATISGNTNNPDGQIALLSVISGNSKIIWWSRVQGNGVLQEGQGLNTEDNDFWLDGTPNCMQCAETADFWALSYTRSGASRRVFSRATFNSDVVEYMGHFREENINSDLIIPGRDGNRFTCFNTAFTSSSIKLIGTLYYFDETTTPRTPTTILPNFYEGFEVEFDRLESGGLHIGGNEDYSDRGRGFRILHLGRSLYYYTGYLLTPFFSEWQQYGWDGQEWLEGLTSGKVVHDDAQDLLDGIQISFDDREQANAFFATDFYTLPVAYGALGDDSKTITAVLEVSASNLRYQVAFPTGTSTLVVPGVNPYQLAVPGASEGGFDKMVIEDSSTFLMELDGVRLPFNQVLTDGSTPPSEQFVSVNLNTGVLTFHPSDASKSVSGYYSYNLEL